MTSNYLIVDVHVHTYPSAEMGLRDIDILGAKERSAGHNGSIEDTLAAMKTDRVSKSVMLNWLPIASMRDAALVKLPYGLPDYIEAEREINRTLAGRLERRNLWSCSVAREHPELVAFINADPVLEAEAMRAEIRDKVNHYGAKGIKIQYAGQRLFPHDRRLWPAYETAQELELPILAHSGASPSDTQYAEPKYFGEVLAHFPRLRLVLAHIGAPFLDQSRALARAYPHLNFDCSDIISPAISELTDAELISLFREIGVDRIMFGTDFPFCDRAPLLERMFKMELTEVEKRLILGENARRVYKLA